MRAIGIVLAGGNSKRMRELSNKRAISAMPVAGSFRGIDFALSNMSNSHIQNVAVFTQYNSRSLNEHLSSSKWWDFGRKQGGLFVFTPYTSSGTSQWFQGTADSIYQNMTYLNRSNEEYVVITSGDSIYKMDYRDVIEFHVEKNADITIVYQDMPNKDLSGFGILETDDNQRLISFEEKPQNPKTVHVSLGTYVIRRKLLIDLLEEIVPQGGYNLVNDLIIPKQQELNIYGYGFSKYWNTISTGVCAYYDVNMDFLKKDVRDLFTNEYPYIETKPKDEPPAKYNREAQVVDSIAGSGTIFNGKVEHSVVFRKVYTAEGSTIRNSIIMEGCQIGKNCVIENAILDKSVVVTDGKKIIGESPSNPTVIPKRSVI